MLKIRLSRVGKKKMPIYRMVVSEHTKDMYGDHLETLGQYNPHTKDLAVKNDRIEHWLKMGAQASESVANLLIKLGLMKSEKKAKAVSISKKRQTKIDSKKVATEEAKAKAQAATEVKLEAEKAVEAPAETPVEPEVAPVAEATEVVAENTEATEEVKA